MKYILLFLFTTNLYANLISFSNGEVIEAAKFNSNFTYLNSILEAQGASISFDQFQPQETIEKDKILNQFQKINSLFLNTLTFMLEDSIIQASEINLLFSVAESELQLVHLCTKEDTSINYNTDNSLTYLGLAYHDNVQECRIGTCIEDYIIENNVCVPDQAPLKLTIKPTSNIEFQLVLIGVPDDPESYNFHIEWGDSTSQDVVSSGNETLTHNFPQGEFTIKIYGTYKVFNQYYANAESKAALDSAVIGNTGLVSLTHAFSDSNLRELSFAPNSTDNVTSMHKMLYNASNVISINTTNLNTSNVTDISFAFWGLNNLTSLDVSNFDTSKVTTMAGTFGGLHNVEVLDVSSFDTSNVTSFSQMFDSMYKVITLDVSSFNTSKVTNMQKMFYKNNKLTNLNVSNFNTSNVTDMAYMFYDCNSLSTLDITNFDTSKVVNITGMFHGFKFSSIDLSNFNTDSVQYMSYLFADSDFTSLNLSNFNTSNVKNMKALFYKNYNLETINLSSFNTSNVTDMSLMFYDCSALTSLDLSNFDTSNVTSMLGMFKNLKLNSLDLSNFNTAKVTTMSGMFADADELTSLNLSSFNTSNVTNMKEMFLNNIKLISLDLSNFNTAKVTTMEGMFRGLNSLTSLDISNFDTSSVITMDSMFSYTGNSDNSLILDLSSFDISNVTDMDSMFKVFHSDYVDLSSWSTPSATQTDMFSNTVDIICDFDTNQAGAQGELGESPYIMTCREP